MKYIFSFLFTVFFAIISFSQNPESSLLWEIKGKKVKSPSYIFGTMHLIPKQDFLFPESLSQKVADADILIMEIGGISEQMSALQFMMLKEGNLFDYFTTDQSDSLFQYFKEELNEDKESVKSKYGKMKPMVLLQLMTQKSFGENPSSYEMSLEAVARKNDVSIEGLETIEQQIGFFDKMTMDEQVEMVMAALNNSEEALEETQKLIDVYLSQNIDSMALLITNSDIGTESFEEEFLTKRNEDWVPKIKGYIKKNSCFIAVGAGHLGGEKGVIELLRKEGYTLEPVLFE